MRTLRLAAAAALVLGLAAAPLHAQQLLKKLESKLKTVIDTVAPETPAGPAAGAPGTGYLGVVADETPVPGQGVLVQMVRKGAPSELGGLKDGDIITTIDDKPCRGLDDLDAALGKATIGTRLKMTVNRGGANETLTITLGKKPAPPAVGTELPGEPPALTPPATPAPADPLLLPPATPPRPAIPATPAVPPTPAVPLDLPAPPTPATPTTPPVESSFDPAPAAGGRASLGVTVVPLTEESRAQFAVRSTVSRGAVIVAVRPGGPADTAGLPIGGVIRSIDGVRVESAEDLIGVVSRMRPGQEVELQYMQGDLLTRKAVKLGAASATAAVPAVPAFPAEIPAVPGDRPILRRVESLLDPFRNNNGNNTEPRTPIGSTIMDPSAIKTLFDRVKSLEDQNASLLDRIKLLEAKLSPTAPAINPLP